MITDALPWISGVAHIALLVLFAILTVALSRADLRTRRIPNEILMPGIVLSLGLIVGTGLGEPGALWETVLVPLVSAAALLLLFVVLILIVPGRLGVGDAKLAILIGIVSGHALGLLGPVIAAGVMFILGAAASIVDSFRTKDKRSIAFAPWMFVGAWTAVAVAALQRWVQWG